MNKAGTGLLILTGDARFHRKGTIQSSGHYNVEIENNRKREISTWEDNRDVPR